MLAMKKLYYSYVRSINACIHMCSVGKALPSAINDIEAE